jgi:hypothetical protein
MDHVDAVLNGNLDDFVNRKVGLDGRVLATLSDHVSLVSLLTVHAETILMTVDGHSLQRQLVRSSENTDSYTDGATSARYSQEEETTSREKAGGLTDFSTVGNQELVQMHDR